MLHLGYLKFSTFFISSVLAFEFTDRSEIGGSWGQRNFLSTHFPSPLFFFFIPINL